MEFLRDGRFGVQKVDGIKAENVIDMSIGTQDKNSTVYKEAKSKYLGDVFLIFDNKPENIKLADGSNKTFNPKDSRIKFSLGKPDKIKEGKKALHAAMKTLRGKIDKGIHTKEDFFKEFKEQLGNPSKEVFDKLWNEGLSKTTPLTAAKKSKKVTSSEYVLLKDQIRTLARGAKMGMKAQKELLQEVSQKLDEIFGKRNRDISKSLAKKLLAVNEKNVEKVIEEIERAKVKADRKEGERIAKDIKSKIPRHSKKTPRNVRATGEAITHIEPRWVDDPNELIALVSEYLTAVKGGGGLDNVVTEVKRLREQADKNHSDYIDEKLREEYNKSDFKDALTFDEFKEMSLGEMEIEDEASELELPKKSKGRTNLERVIKWRQQEIEQKLKDPKLTPKERNTLESIMLINDKIDINEFTSVELRDLNNIISEIITFDSYDSSGPIETIINGKHKGDKIANSGIGVQWSRFIDKQRLGGHLSNLVSFNNFFKAIAGGKGGKALRNMFVAKLNEGSNVVQKLSDKFNSDLDRLYRDLKDRDKSLTKVGMISYLYQHEQGSLDSDVVNDFEAKKLLMELQIQKMKELSEDKKSPKSKRKNFKKIAELQEEIYNEFIKDDETKEDVLSKLTKEERKVYDYVLDSFDKTKDKLKDSHKRFNGKEFIEFENYIPTAQVTVDNIQSKDVNLTNRSLGFKNVDTKSSSTTIKRVKIPTKNTDGTVNNKVDSKNLNTVHIFDFNLVAKQKYKEALYDIHTLRERKTLHSAVNSSAVKKMFGKDLHRLLAQKLGTKIDMQKGTFQDGLKEASDLAKKFYKVARYYKATKLKTVDQWIKQPASIIAHSVGQIGPRNTIQAMSQMAKVLSTAEGAEAFNKLIEKSEVANRVSEGEFTFKDQKSLIELAMKKGKLDDTTIGKIYLNAFEGALANGDKFATRLTWLAAYIKEAQKNGNIENVSDFDVLEAADNIDLDALHKADNISQEINNISDYSDAPEMFTKGDNHLTRELLYTFRSFSVNMWINNAIALRDLVNSKGLDVDKKESMRLIAGSMMAVVTFQGIKQFVVNPLWDKLVETMFGIEGDDDEDKTQEKLKKTLYNSLSDYLIGGAIGGEFTEEAFKEMSNFIATELDEDVASRKEYPPYYVGKGFKIPGSLGLPFEAPISMYRRFDDYMDDGEIKESTDYESLGALMGILGEGSVERLFSKAASKARKEERTPSSSKSKKKTSKKKTSPKKTSPKKTSSKK
jgi:hypothetical protein